MDDRHKTLGELVSAFETRYEKVVVQLNELDGLTAGANSGAFAEIDQGFRNQGEKTRHSCHGNLIGHAILSRRASVGPVYDSARRSSMAGSQHFPVLPSSKLPRIPVWRMSSDHTGSGRDFVQIHQETLTNFNNAHQTAKSEFNLKNVRDIGQTALKRGSFPREQDRSFGYQRVPEEDAPRGRRGSWSSVGMKSRPTSCRDTSRWRTGLHRRTLNIDDDDDDDDDDYRDLNRSRSNSSSSRFSSISNLF